MIPVYTRMNFIAWWNVLCNLIYILRFSLLRIREKGGIWNWKISPGLFQQVYLNFHWFINAQSQKKSYIFDEFQI